MAPFTLISRNASSDENGRFDEILSDWRFLCKLHHGLSGPDGFDEFQSNPSKHNQLGGNDDFDEFLSNVGSDKNGRFYEILSHWRSLCKLHHGMSGANDFDKFQSDSSKHNQLGGNDDFHNFLSNFTCRK